MIKKFMLSSLKDNFAVFTILPENSNQHIFDRISFMSLKAFHFLHTSKNDNADGHHQDIFSFIKIPKIAYSKHQPIKYFIFFFKFF